MKYTKLRNPARILISVILITLLAACSTQNWYSGAQSAQTANCMKQPISEYNDCQQQTTENYDSYEKKRQELLIEENSKQE